MRNSHGSGASHSMICTSTADLLEASAVAAAIETANSAVSFSWRSLWSESSFCCVCWKGKRGRERDKYN